MNTKLSLYLVSLSTVFIVSACGGEGSISSTTPANNAASAIPMAAAVDTIGNNNSGYPAGPNLGGYYSSAAPTCGSSPTVECLERVYESNFCQLDQGGSLTSAQCQANIAYIASQPETGNFDLNKKPILNNSVGVTGVNFSSINYATTVPLPNGNQTFTVSGGLAMPTGIEKSKIKGVITYFHGTQLDNQDVGSNISSPNTLLALSVFTSQGYIVVLPDYIGQGANYGDVHPYVIYPQATAKTAIDMLSAVKQSIQSQYGYVATDKLKLFSIGYSEGGAYSLWFNAYINDNPKVLDAFYTLTHSVGAEGAYSTSDVTKSFLFADVSKSPNLFNIQNQWLTNGVKPALFADAMLSFATYSLNADFSLFNPAFYALTCGNSLLADQAKCKFGATKYNLAQSFRLSATSPASQVLNSAFGKTMGNYTFIENELMLFISSHNSAFSLLSSEDLANGSTAIGAKLNAALVAADVNLSNIPNRSVSIITLDQDSVVSPNNYDVLLGKYAAKIKTAIKIPAEMIQVVSPLSTNKSALKYMPTDHIEGNAYTFLYALNIFNQF
ncbi:hypothetical protein LZG75_06090 [Polynucleobacter sp. IMCC30063]|uniref:prolyl oligopeptidase family serine peptidase n=1 Tax=Polynucleobacter sp. IMCC30063 TaxID=2907298 RepID=UPI001F1FD838|nr:prolyl oligopeptidase family serine peptidase [Polynucleobacter sp. IMCC30063]MCE7505809.1 hypothetical protein [Polynucleobacter sp. IMCC30063]